MATLLNAYRTISCQVSHQYLPKTKLFLYQQTVQLKTGRSSASCERNLLKWWTEIQSHLEVIDNILQKHIFISLYPPTEREENTKYSRIFRRIYMEKSAGARKLRKLLATRDKTWRQQHQITRSLVKKGDCDCSIVMQLWYKIWLLNGSRVLM